MKREPLCVCERSTPLAWSQPGAEAQLMQNARGVASFLRGSRRGVASRSPASAHIKAAISQIWLDRPTSMSFEHQTR